MNDEEKEKWSPYDINISSRSIDHGNNGDSDNGNPPIREASETMGWMKWAGGDDERIE